MRKLQIDDILYFSIYGEIKSVERVIRVTSKRAFTDRRTQLHIDPDEFHGKYKVVAPLPHDPLYGELQTADLVEKVKRKEYQKILQNTDWTWLDTDTLRKISDLVKEAKNNKLRSN